MILTRWNFPPELACIPSQLRIYDRQSPDADFVDLVQIAELQTASEYGNVGSNHALTRMDWSGISAFERLGFDPENARETLESFRDSFQMARDLYR